jgi:exonuclease III
MTRLQDWASQFCAELEKQSSARAAQVESLLFCGDYQAIREWLAQWEAEDAEPESLRVKYRQTIEKLRRLRQSQINEEASADSLRRSSADRLPERTVTLDSGD